MEFIVGVLTFCSVLVCEWVAGRGRWRPFRTATIWLAIVGTVLSLGVLLREAANNNSTDLVALSLGPVVVLTYLVARIARRVAPHAVLDSERPSAMIVLTIVRSHLKSPHPVDQLIAPVGDYLDSARDWLWRDLGGFAIVIIGCVFIGMAVVMTLLATIVLTVVGGIVGSWMEPWEPLLLHELTARVWDGFYALPYIANGALGLGIAWVVLRPLVVGIKQTDKWELHTK